MSLRTAFNRDRSANFAGLAKPQCVRHLRLLVVGVLRFDPNLGNCGRAVTRLRSRVWRDFRTGRCSTCFSTLTAMSRPPPDIAVDINNGFVTDKLGTLAHETTHWTGHASRLARDFGPKRFGSEGYAVEELVAELGAAFLCADLDLALEPREDHASYIANWLQVLKNDNRAIFSAASHAQRAVDYLHGLQAQSG